MSRVVALALALLVVACGGEARQAYQDREAWLALRFIELQVLSTDAAAREAARRKVEAEERLQSELDLARALRELEAGVTLSTEGDQVRASLRGDVGACAEALARLLPLRWQLGMWRLRLEGSRCEWEAEPDAELAATRKALLMPTAPAWSPPPIPWLAFGVPAIARRIAELETRVRGLEASLGALAFASAHAREVAHGWAVVEAAKQAPVPCDLAILQRALARDPAERGQLLEVSTGRLVHPFEPASDFRLRGLVQRDEAGRLTWRCETN
jgi:hypothetical protein